MEVWLVTTGEPLPSDGACPRLLRTGILAQQLADRGHSVTWWTSSFDHTAKSQRCSRDEERQLQSNYSIRLICSPGYSKNISMQRIRDHVVMARRFRHEAERRASPDLLLCSLPTVELSATSASYGYTHQVPVVLDIRDMWPDIIAEAMPRWMQPLATVALAKLSHACRQACRQAYAITGHAPGFVNWGLEKANRCRGPMDQHFAFGYTDVTPQAHEVDRAARFWDKLGVVQSPLRPLVCFAGAIGKQFRLDTVIQAAKLTANLSPQLAPLFVLCGNGDAFENYRSAAAGCPHVYFPGWVERPEIWELMRRSSLALAPYRNSRDFQLSIPNKAIEYLSGGLPVLTSLSNGVLPDLLRKYDCGLSYHGDAQQLAGAVRRLLDDDETLRKMSKNALDLFQRNFTADRVYGSMADHLERIAQTHAAEKLAAGSTC